LKEECTAKSSKASDKNMILSKYDAQKTQFFEKSQLFAWLLFVSP